MNVNSLMNSQTNPANSANSANSVKDNRQTEQPSEPAAKPIPPESSDESFIDKAYRSIVLNRMGVDTEQLEKIEQEIEELESLSNLNKEEKEKLESLKEARDQLFEDAMRRQAENGTDSSSANPNGIPPDIANQYDARAISPDDMNELATDLYDAGLITEAQRSRMSFQFVKTHFYKTYTPESQQVDPSEPMDFVSLWEDRVKANDYFNVPADQKARDQGILDVLRRV